MTGGALALTLNGFRENRRNRVTVVAVVFAIILLIGSTLITNLSVSTYDRVLTDLGVGLMAIVLTLLAIFLSTGLLGREIERRTVFIIVSKPISRSAFLLSRFAGNMLTLAVLLLVMGLLFLGEVVLYGSNVTQAQVSAIGMLFFELLILSSVGFALSSFSSQMVSATVTLSVYFAGHLSGDIYRLAYKTSDVALQLLAKGTYYLLPNLERVNFRTRATYAIPSTAHELLSAAAYACAYSAVMLAIAVIAFRRRDFK